MSCRRGDSDFTLQEGVTAGTLLPMLMGGVVLVIGDYSCFIFAGGFFLSSLS